MEDGILDSLDALSYANLADSLDIVLTEMTVIKSSILDSMESRLDYLYSQLDSIETLDHFDEQLQALLKIWVSNALYPGDTLTSGQVEALDDWGQSCRFVDGPAVVMARALLRMRGVSQPNGDHPDCLEELNNEADIRSNEEVGKWRLVPTVTNGSSLLERIQPLRIDAKIMLEVFDHNGRCHYKGVCNGNRQWLDFTGMPGGGYFIRISEGERPPVVIRMVKI
ncbi:MAG: hypothetical protein J5I41_03650 [Saprospiraceae bacterium]|nr:hypothetical protein [Saprospiraceae bacterium]